MAHVSDDDNYVQTYQKYLIEKGGAEDLRISTSYCTGSTRILKQYPSHEDCKICQVLTIHSNLSRILNQGLYYKYTSSQDFFYSRDINYLLMKKKKAFCVRYYDDLTFDECVERLKKYYKKKDIRYMMKEITQFYSKFYNYPRNFHKDFEGIMSSNVRRHRRIEYMKVFQHINVEEENEENEKNKAEVNKDDSGELKLSEKFNFMETLGKTFLNYNYQEFSNVIVGEYKLDQRRTTEYSIKEIERNFLELHEKKIPKNAIFDPYSLPFSNAFTNQECILYSHRDSQTAGDLLKQIINGFTEIDTNSRPSISLLDQILEQPNQSQVIKKQKERKYSPVLKSRLKIAGDLSQSPLLKKSPNSYTATNLHKPAKSQLFTTIYQAPVNIKSNIGLLNDKNVSKISPSRLVGQDRSKKKFVGEALNNIDEISITRENISSSASHLRSTRNKNGIQMVVSTHNKSSISRPKLDLNFETIEESQPNIHSLSPGKLARDSSGRTPLAIETGSILMNKITSFSPSHKLQKSISGDFNDVFSSCKSLHKKSQSLIKKSPSITKKYFGHPIGITTPNNIASYFNAGQNTLDSSPVSSTRKIISPQQRSHFIEQTYNPKTRSSIKDTKNISPERYRVPTQKAQNTSMKPLQNLSPKRPDEGENLSSISRRQKFLELSHGSNSFTNYTPSSILVGKTPTSTNKNAEFLPYAAKLGKRGVESKKNYPVSTTELSAMRNKKTKRASDMNEEKLTSSKNYKSLIKESLIPPEVINQSTTSLNKFKKNIFGMFTPKSEIKSNKTQLKK